MSNNLVKKNNGGLLPDNIGNATLNQLLSRSDVEVHKKDNKITLKQKTPTESVTVEIRAYPDTTTVSQSRTARTRPINQMGDTIKQMRSEGQTQADIADKLGTTQSNISKIEKTMKK
ncbi:hypothetical protein [Anaerotignum sp.]|uniref:hypothetical protein n=1 Tax=Anaerotignum sp. TaxID=2039241 RepID=UPI0027152434|nr:hypothetical protein [Anaerotignum sp.]